MTATEPPLADETLRDGRVVTVRRLGPDDAPGIEALWRRLDAADRHRFVDMARLPPERPGRLAARRPGSAGIVALSDQGTTGRVVGVAHLRRVLDDAATFMVFVDAEFRRVGLGTLLLRHLAMAARGAGVRRLVSDVPRDDVAVLGLLAELGLAYEERDTGTGVHATLAVQETDAYLDAVLGEQRRAARAALEPFLRPRSIAVVGASDRRGSLGGLLLDNLLASAFAGDVYPVNPRHPTLHGRAAFPALSACPEVPDLVLVAVPAPAVPAVIDEAGAVGSRAVCVITSGFAEVGTEGRARQDELRRHARAAGVRLLGPNCMGLLNGGPPRFNGTFSPSFPPPGRLAFVSQSGGLGLAALSILAGPSLGVSGFVSVGNAADLGPNDLLLYWGDDPGTDLVLAYLEAVPSPRRFARIARSVARRKPVVVMKAGRSPAGRRAAASHTAAMAAGEVAVEALFRQAGVIRAGTLEEMFDVAKVASSQPVPPGRRVAVLTNGGGPGILVADACAAAGLLVPELSERTQAELRAHLSQDAAVANPVDMVASATAVQYGQSLRVLLAAEEVDAVIVVFVPPFLTRAEDVASELAESCPAGSTGKTVVAVFMTTGTVPPTLAEAGIPTLAYPERAAAALGRLAQWAEWRARPEGRVVTPTGTDPARGRSLVTAALGDLGGEGWVDVETAQGLLAAYGIPTVWTRRVHGPDEAAAAQAALGRPVVVKLAAPIHKSDIGGVAVGLDSPQAAAEAARTVRAAAAEAGLGDEADELLVQEEVGEGVEMIVGVSHDPSFGPLVLVGLGGTTAEVLGDVALRLTPLSDVDVDEMLRSLRSWPILTGYRGEPPLDVGALAELVHRVGAMVEDLPEIAELDVNPVFVRRHGVTVADVRLRLERGAPTF